MIYSRTEIYFDKRIYPAHGHDTKIAWTLYIQC